MRPLNNTTKATRTFKNICLMQTLSNELFRTGNKAGGKKQLNKLRVEIKIVI